MSPWRAITPRGRWIIGTGLVLAVAGALLRYPVVAGLGAILVALVAVEVVVVLRRPDVTVRRTVDPLVVVRQGRCTGHLHAAGGRTPLVRTAAQETVDGRLMPLADVDAQGGRDDLRHPHEPSWPRRRRAAPAAPDRRCPAWRPPSPTSATWSSCACSPAASP